MVRFLWSGDSVTLSVSCKFVPLNNHWMAGAFVEQVMTTASLFSVTLVVLARRVGTLRSAVEKQGQ